MDHRIEELRQDVEQLEQMTKTFQGFQSKTLQHDLALAYKRLAEALVSTGDLYGAIGAFNDADTSFDLAGESSEGQKMQAKAHQLLVRLGLSR